MSPRLKKVGKGLLLFFAFLLLLLLVLQLKPVQNVLSDWILKRISQQYQAEWKIGSVHLKFFDEIALEDVAFYDQTGDSLLIAEAIHVDIGLFNLLRKKLDIESVKIQGAHAEIRELGPDLMNFSFLIPASSATNPEESSTGWDIGLGQIGLLDSRVQVTTESEHLDLREEELEITFRQFDLANKQIVANGIRVDGLQAQYTAIGNNTVESGVFLLPTLDWTLGVDELVLEESELVLIQNDSARVVDIEEINLANLNYSDDGLQGRILKITGQYDDQLQMVEAEGELLLFEDSLHVTDLRLLTLQDRLEVRSGFLLINQQRTLLSGVDLILSPPTVEMIKHSLPEEINLSKSTDLSLQARRLELSASGGSVQGLNLRLGKLLAFNGSAEATIASSHQWNLTADVQRLVTNPLEFQRTFPSIEVPDSLLRYQSLTASGHITGSPNKLNFKDFSLGLDDVLTGTFSGHVANLNQGNKMSFDLETEGVRAFIPALSIVRPDNIALDSLGLVNFSGRLMGDLSDFNVNGCLQSNLGAADLDMQLTIPEDISQLKYSGELALLDFDAGTFLLDDDLGTLSVRTHVDGQGSDFSSFDSEIEGSIENFTYRGYIYDDVQINAIITDSIIDGQVMINDQNLSMQYEGLAHISKFGTILDFTLMLDTINLKELNLIDDSLSLSGRVDAKMKLPLPVDEDGLIKITDLIVARPHQKFIQDSITIAANRSQDSLLVRVESEWANLTVAGDYTFANIVPSLMHLVDHRIPMANTKKPATDLANNVRLRGTINSLDPLDIVMPQLGVMSTSIRTDLALDFVDHAARGSISTDSFALGEISTEDLQIVLSTAQDGTTFANLEAGRTTMAGIEVASVSLQNALQDSFMVSDISIVDYDRLPKLKTRLNLTQSGSTLLIEVQDSFALNKRNWVVSEDNSIEISEQGLSVDHLRISDHEGYLEVNTTGNRNSDLKIEMENFAIDEFITLVTSKPSRFSGDITGDVSIKEFADNPSFLINSDIAQLYLDSSYIGTLNIDANQDPNSRSILTFLKLSGPENNLRGQGSYNPSSGTVKADLSIEQVELKILDPFLAEIMYDSEGKLAGELHVQGSLESPALNGKVTLTDAITTIAVNNVRYGLGEAQIDISTDAFSLSDLTLYDQYNNALILNGSIYHDRLNNFELDITSSSDEFLFLNTTAKNNPVFHGKLLLDANADLIGPIDNLEIDVQAKTLDSTSITLSPFSAEEIIAREDYVTYGRPEDFEDQTEVYLEQLAQQFPFRANILLETSEVAKMTFVVDPVSGDQIEAAGTGTLRVVFNPDGGQEIYGTYTVQQGTYAFSYGDFVNKNFTIQPGGTVRFNGDPTAAEMNIKAIYAATTSPYDLIRNEVVIDQDEISSAQDQTEVNVVLNLKGTLLTPEISLDIDIPNLGGQSLVSSIDRKLNELRNDPNEMNSQVFGLLLFDSFILNSDASSSISTIGGNIALKSLSGLVSSQLNRLAENVIKGVDVSINVNSYESNYLNEGAGGNVTQIGLAVSKSLFQDRLSISAGGNVDLTSQNQASSYAAFLGDFVLEYKLTPSGRYRLRVFSKSDYDRLLNENSSRNGVSIFFNRSFDSRQ